jgi:hypothetical protein
MKKYLLLILLSLSINISAQLSHLQNKMTKSQIVNTINSNLDSIENLGYLNLIYPLKKIDVDYTSSELITNTNDNFDTLSLKLSLGSFSKLNYLISGSTIRSRINNAYDSIFSYAKNAFITPFTTSYFSRVVSDGGTIIDSSYINNCYKKIYSLDVNDSLLCWYSPSFGIKKDINGKVTKSYNLIGTQDAIKTDTSKAPIFINSDANFNLKPSWDVTNRTFQVTNLVVPTYIDYLAGVNLSNSGVVTEHGANVGSVPGFLIYSTANAPIKINRSSTISYINGVNLWAQGNSMIIGATYNNKAQKYCVNYNENIPTTNYIITGNPLPYSNITSNLNLYSRNNSSIFLSGTATDIVLFKEIESIKSFSIRKLLMDRYKPSVIDYYNTINDTLMFYKIASQPNSRQSLHIIDQHELNVLASVKDSILLSFDGGETYPYSIYTKASDSISFGHIFKNKNVIFCTTQNKIYRSIDSLNSISLIGLYKNKIPYVFHTPVNATYPGSYFLSLNHYNNYITIDNHELLVWGNYTNASQYGNGATPVIIYYSFDNVDSLHVAFEFGQNTCWRDDGTVDGGTTGNLLGDTSISLKAEHVHNVIYRPIDTSFYAFTGDALTCTSDSVGWIKGKINLSNNSWTWNMIAKNSTDGPFKTVGAYFYANDDSIIWASDGSTYGIFTAKFSEIKTKRTTLFNYTGGMISAFVAKQDTLVFNEEGRNVNSLYISTDFGKTWNIKTFNLYQSIDYIKIIQPGNNWWQQSGKFNLPHEKTVLFKIK